MSRKARRPLSCTSKRLPADLWGLKANDFRKVGLEVCLPCAIRLEIAFFQVVVEFGKQGVEVRSE